LPKLWIIFNIRRGSSPKAEVVCIELQPQKPKDKNIFVYPVGASIRKPLVEPTFEQTTQAITDHMKNTAFLNKCPLLLKTDHELY
jgi:hypothetical protein